MVLLDIKIRCQANPLVKYSIFYFLVFQYLPEADVKPLPNTNGTRYLLDYPKPFINWTYYLISWASSLQAQFIYNSKITHCTQLKSGFLYYKQHWFSVQSKVIISNYVSQINWTNALWIYTRYIGTFKHIIHY